MKKEFIITFVDDSKVTVIAEGIEEAKKKAKKIFPRVKITEIHYSTEEVEQ